MPQKWDVLATGFQLAEAPTIDTDGSLLFSDVLGGGVHRLDQNGAVTIVVPKRRGVGGLALHAEGGIVCSGRDIIHARNGESRTVLHVDGVSGWNDLCTDQAGRDVLKGAWSEQRPASDRAGIRRGLEREHRDVAHELALRGRGEPPSGPLR